MQRWQHPECRFPHVARPVRSSVRGGSLYAPSAVNEMASPHTLIDDFVVYLEEIAIEKQLTCWSSDGNRHRLVTSQIPLRRTGIDDSAT